MPVFDRFVPTRAARPPYAYVLDSRDTALVNLLWRHGIRAMSAAGRNPGAADEFVVDSLVRSARPFQGHNEVRIVGRWRRADSSSLEQGWPRADLVLVQVAGTYLAPLAMYLLDPESDDSFATWNLLDGYLRVGRPYPVRRILDKPLMIR